MEYEICYSEFCWCLADGSATTRLKVKLKKIDPVVADETKEKITSSFILLCCSPANRLQ